MAGAKIRLSQKEAEIIGNSDLILTKNAILQKVNQLLVSLQQQQHGHILYHEEWLPPEWIRSSPKIARGENYKGLPWLMLDYPRIFNKEEIAAIRTMFWWGNHFSITLHLSGSYKKKAEKKLISLWQMLDENAFYACIQQDQWQHDFGSDNYCLVSEINEDQKRSIYDRSFLKLAKRIPLSAWEDAEEELEKCFNQLLLLLTD